MNTVSLFSYGSLQARDVQRAVFGREVQGREDWAIDYTMGMISVDGAQYANLEPSAGASARGTVLEITEQDLEAADAYEEDAKYDRIRVRLASGEEAWSYVRS